MIVFSGFNTKVILKRRLIYKVLNFIGCKYTLNPNKMFDTFMKIYLCVFSFYIIFDIIKICMGGGIGRHAGLRCLWTNVCVGSSPIPCTTCRFSLMVKQITRND